MAAENCPDCGEHIGAPLGSHGMLHEAKHANRACPKCKRPLIWFTEGELAGKWRIDEAEERRQRLAED